MKDTATNIEYYRTICYHTKYTFLVKIHIGIFFSWFCYNCNEPMDGQSGTQTHPIAS